MNQTAGLGPYATRSMQSGELFRTLPTIELTG
jgi:hypothetical protein